MLHFLPLIKGLILLSIQSPTETVLDVSGIFKSMGVYQCVKSMREFGVQMSCVKPLMSPGGIRQDVPHPCLCNNTDL